jgi:hypothetical protein
MACPVRSLGKGETGIASTQEKETQDKLSIGQIEGNAVAVLSHIPGRTLISRDNLCLEHIAYLHEPLLRTMLIFVQLC